jgi:hypothetical protein
MAVRALTPAVMAALRSDGCGADFLAFLVFALGAVASLSLGGSSCRCNDLQDCEKRLYVIWYRCV